MWRFVVATAMLVLMVVLVVDMLFGGSRSLGIVDRYPSPPSWTAAERRALFAGRAVTSGVSPTAAATATANAPADGGSLGNPVSGQDRWRSEATPPGEAETTQTRWLDGGDAEPWPGQIPPPPLPADDAPDTAGTLPHDRVLPTPTPAERATRAQVLDAQQLLAALGYNPGPSDGRTGPRTIAAVREFQRSIRQPTTGQIDTQLLAQLDAEHRTWSRLRQQELEVMSPEPVPAPEKPGATRGVFGSLLGGVQRLMGRNFDSIRSPEDISVYCHGNVDSWIYDFGREAFVYCGNVLAGQAASASTELTGSR